MAEWSTDISTESVCASGDAETEPSHSLICQPCDENGEQLQAREYCQDCAMYLCKTCIKCHKRLPSTRDHTLLNGDDMPQDGGQGTPSPPDICTEKCTEHGDIVKYYCFDDGQFGCTVCVTLDHRNCKIGFIPKISKDVLQGEEYTDLMTKINDLMDRSANLKNDAVTYENQSDKLDTELLEDIDTFRTEINQLLDRIVCNVKAKTDNARKRNEEHITNMSNKSKKAEEGLTVMMDNIGALINTKQFCKLFREIKNAKSTVMEIETELGEIVDNGIKQYKFVWHNIQCLLDTAEVKINEPSHIMCADKGEIRVRSDKDSQTCDISGMVLMPAYSDKLMMVNKDSKSSIKAVDRRKKTLATELRLSSYPWDISPFTANKLAVTFPRDKKIVVIQWNKDRESLSTDTEWPMNGECRGISSLQDNLVVAYTNPGKVEIIDNKGKTIQSFSKDENGDNLFSCPMYVVVSADGQSIYVTDEDKHSVSCLGLDGKLKAIYKDDQLKKPQGICVDRLFGTVFVCGHVSQNIYVLTPDLRKVKVLLQGSDGISRPYSLYLCEDTDQLYVGMYDKNETKVYQLTRYSKS